MSAKLYVVISLVLSGIDCVALTWLQIMRSELTGDVPTVMLGLKNALDAVFVLTNIRHCKLRGFPLIALCWVLFCFGTGIVNIAADSDHYLLSRALKDTIAPTFFLLKLPVLAYLLSTEELNWRWITQAMFAISGLNIVIFYFLDGQDVSYVGLTPPITAPIVASVVTSSSPWFFACLVLVYYSGKRSFLFSLMAFLVFAFYKLTIATNQVKKSFFIKIFVVVSLALSFSVITGSPMSEKLRLTFDGLIGSGILRGSNSAAVSESLGGADSVDALYLASAGRSEEISAVLSTMTAFSWMFGHGAGFTYTLTAIDSSFDSSYANVHFSPLGLAYKYGAPFALIFYIWLCSFVLRNERSPDCLLWQGVGLMLVIQSLFAFNLFVEFLMPFFIVLVAPLRPRPLRPFRERGGSLVAREARS